METLNGVGQETTPVHAPALSGFDVVVAGDFVGTLTVEASKNGSTQWVPIATLDGPGVFPGKLNRAYYVKVGFKTGDYTSGTAEVEVR